MYLQSTGKSRSFGTETIPKGQGNKIRKIIG